MSNVKAMRDNVYVQDCLIPVKTVRSIACQFRHSFCFFFFALTPNRLNCRWCNYFPFDPPRPMEENGEMIIFVMSIYLTVISWKLNLICSTTKIACWMLNTSINKSNILPPCDLSLFQTRTQQVTGQTSLAKEWGSLSLSFFLSMCRLIILSTIQPTSVNCCCPFSLIPRNPNQGMGMDILGTYQFVTELALPCPAQSSSDAQHTADECS